MSSFKCLIKELKVTRYKKVVNNCLKYAKGREFCEKLISACPHKRQQRRQCHYYTFDSFGFAQRKIQDLASSLNQKLWINLQDKNDRFSTTASAASAAKWGFVKIIISRDLSSTLLSEMSILGGNARVATGQDETQQDESKIYAFSLALRARETSRDVMFAMINHRRHKIIRALWENICVDPNVQIY